MGLVRKARTAMLLGAAVLLLPVSSASAAGSGHTLVTLSFDDSLDSHVEVARILDRHGLHGTFFVNTNRVGGKGYLTWKQIHAFAAAGHEIGGHTLDHVHLFRENADEARRQICEDRAALVAQGFSPVSFSYPYAESGPEEAQLVSECGYLFGRTEGGISGLGGADDRLPAETLPPADRLALRTRPGVTVDWSLEDLEAYVERTEAAGGGWMNFTFHSVLADCGGMRYCIDPADLEAFAGWLAQRGPGTRVVTLADAFLPYVVDRLPPSVVIESPDEAGFTLDGTYALEARAVDDVAVARVLFMAGYRIVGHADAPPWIASWDTRTVPDGTWELRAVAIDTSGRIGVAPARSVVVANGTAAPAQRRLELRPPAGRTLKPVFGGAQGDRALPADSRRRFERRSIGTPRRRARAVERRHVRSRIRKR